MKVGERVNHPIYGLGTIIKIERTVQLGDNNTWDRSQQSSIIRSTNGQSRYSGNLNVAVKFDNGGPQGFAIDASNEVKELEVMPSAANVEKVLIAQVIY